MDTSVLLRGIAAEAIRHTGDQDYLDALGEIAQEPLLDAPEGDLFDWLQKINGENVVQAPQEPVAPEPVSATPPDGANQEVLQNNSPQVRPPAHTSPDVQDSPQEEVAAETTAETPEESPPPAPDDHAQSEPAPEETDEDEEEEDTPDQKPTLADKVKANKKEDKEEDKKEDQEEDSANYERALQAAEAHWSGAPVPDWELDCEQYVLAHLGTTAHQMTPAEFIAYEQEWRPILTERHTALVQSQRQRQEAARVNEIITKKKRRKVIERNEDGDIISITEEEA